METGIQWTHKLEQVRQQAPRSVMRGLGPSALKLDLRLDRVTTTFAEDLAQAAKELAIPDDCIAVDPFAAVVTASWFLLRGIELANVQCQDVSFNRERREVSLKLPVSKTDVQAKGCVRTHSAHVLSRIREVAGANSRWPCFLRPCRNVRDSCTQGRHCLVRSMRC